MKLKYIISALTAIAVVSCQKSDNEPDFNLDPNTVRVEATVGGLVTRSNPLEEGAASTVFKTSDVVMVAAEAQGAVGYTFNGTTWSAEADKCLRWDTPTMNFKAWYPQTASMTDFPLPTDQSTTAGIESADYMTYSGTHTKDGTNPISLTLQRKTARVILKIAVFGDEYIYMGREQKVSNVKIHSGAAAYSADAVNGSVTELTPYTTDNGEVNSVYTALVIPTTAQATETFISVVDGGNYTLLTKGIPAMEAGKSYTYNLKVGKDDVVITGITVNDWTTGEVIPDGEGEMIEPWDGTVAERFAKGSGTESDPFQIHSAAELAFMSTIKEPFYNLRNYFKLCADINLGYRDWTPIGSGYDKNNPTASPDFFRGLFDGGGHTITGLKVTNVNDYKNIGLFGGIGQDYTLSGKPYTAIKNLNIVGARVEITAKFDVNSEDLSAGILAAGTYGTVNIDGDIGQISIVNCHVSGTFTATEISENSRFWGGIVGKGSIAHIDNCSADVTIINGCVSGGIAGGLYGSKVTNCSSKGTINGSWTLGGFVGNAVSNVGSQGFPDVPTVIENCKSSVNITSNNWNVGGFAGWSNATINNCTASGNVTSTVNWGNHYYKTGGFAGTNAGVIKNSVYSGTLRGADTDAEAWKYYGGFIGNSNNGRTVNCRFDGTKNSDYGISGLSWMNEGATTGNDISDSL